MGAITATPREDLFAQLGLPPEQAGAKGSLPVAKASLKNGQRRRDMDAREPRRPRGETAEGDARLVGDGETGGAPAPG